MDAGTIILILGAVLLLAINLFLVARFVIWRPQPQKEGQQADQSFVLLQQQMQELSRTMHERMSETSKLLDQRLAESNKQMNESSRYLHESVKGQLSESSRIIKEVTEGLTKLDETNRQVVSFADQLQHLQDVLKNPKQRGILGEYFLETVLKNTLPPESYEMQYRFGDSEIVDAVVFVKDKIVPIDSKFSVDNYNRIVEEQGDGERDRLEKAFVNDLKLRIKETSKYIRPKEGTTEFAFMFIPHEAIYYELLVNKIGAEESILERAAKEYKVLITSPTSFLAYLQTVLQGLKALQIEEQAQDIIKKVGQLGTHLGKYDTYMQKLGNSLATTVNAYNTAYKELGKIDKDVMRITGETPGVDVLSLEKPVREE
ncbi:DNA recombination protein RmuC [Patescibacteria group bacterium]|jgi:DNA recombination protein RmuC|nr:DNA recombination protein RmuC [Patescibacteria group bacterium]